MLQGENVPGSVLILQDVIQDLEEDGEDASWQRLAQLDFPCSVSVRAKHEHTSSQRGLPLLHSVPPRLHVWPGRRKGLQAARLQEGRLLPTSGSKKAEMPSVFVL